MCTASPVDGCDFSIGRSNSLGCLCRSTAIRLPCTTTSFCLISFLLLVFLGLPIHTHIHTHTHMHACILTNPTSPRSPFTTTSTRQTSQKPSPIAHLPAPRSPHQHPRRYLPQRGKTTRSRGTAPTTGGPRPQTGSPSRSGERGSSCTGRRCRPRTP